MESVIWIARQIQCDLVITYESVVDDTIYTASGRTMKEPHETKS
jgi:hypothetical protein